MPTAVKTPRQHLNEEFGKIVLADEVNGSGAVFSKAEYGALTHSYSPEDFLQAAAAWPLHLRSRYPRAFEALSAAALSMKHSYENAQGTALPVRDNDIRTYHLDAVQRIAREQGGEVQLQKLRKEWPTAAEFITTPPTVRSVKPSDWLKWLPSILSTNSASTP